MTQNPKVALQDPAAQQTLSVCLQDKQLENKFNHQWAVTLSATSTGKPQ